MCKKLTCLTFFVFVFGLGMHPSVVRAQEGLVGYWRFDETSGTTAIDLAGGDNNGTLGNAAQWQPGAGRTGGAVLYDSVQNTGRVEIPTAGMSASRGTIMVWGKLAQPYPTNRNDASYFFGHTTQPSYANRIQFYMNTANTLFDLGLGDTHNRRNDMVNLQTDTWCHVALTWDSGRYVVYLNGEELASGTYTGLTALNTIMDIGNDGNPVSGNQEAFAGLLDEARIYNRALERAEVLAAMKSAPYPFASGPIPKDGALHTDTWVTLTWRPGQLAVSHDVYLGDNFNDVNNGAAGTFRGNQTAALFVAGFPGYAYPDGLVPGTTYYWRIDEVNIAEPNSPWKGPVWSFSIPPRKAYNPSPANGAESVAVNVTLSWTPGHGAKLHTVYFGTDSDTVANAAGGLPQGTAAYTPTGLKLAKTYYWRVDEFDGAATHKGDVWSFTTRGAIGNPNPANGAVNVKPTQVLTWRSGALAASHEVYFGKEADAVKNATKASPEYKATKARGDESYDPGKLTLLTAYYWRVDEVNGVNPDSPWKGNVWSFTTGDFFVLDDFEDYDAGANQIWYSWHDGLGYGTPANPPYFAGNGTGAAVGDETTASFTEETIVHGGKQSMPLNYDNNKQGFAKYSQAELSLAVQRDWTEEGVGELSLWFRGRPASVGSFVESPAGTYTITATGADIWGTADQFHYAFKTLTGVGSIEAQVLSIDNTDPWAKGGVMIRETLAPGSKFAAVYITPGNGCRFQARADTGIAATSDTAVVTPAQTAIKAPYWVKLERDVAGNFRGYYSANGTSWTTMSWNPQNITMASNVYIGLALTSHNNNATCTAKFSGVKTSGTVGVQWASQDIGIASNAAEPLYVAISNAGGQPAVVVHSDTNAATTTTWTQWVIPLQSLADKGINLKSVDKIAIGLGTRGNMTTPGGSGKMYFDDIRLSRPRTP